MITPNNFNPNSNLPNLDITPINSPGTPSNQQQMQPSPIQQQQQPQIQQQQPQQSGSQLTSLQTPWNSNSGKSLFKYCYAYMTLQIGKMKLNYCLLYTSPSPRDS